MIVITSAVQVVINMANHLLLKYDRSGQQFQAKAIRLGKNVDALVRILIGSFGLN